MSVYAPMLAELSVELKGAGFIANHQQQNSSVCIYTDFIGGFTNLEKLHGEFYFTKYLRLGIETCHQTLVFHRLNDIELNEVNFEDMKDVSLVARLILGAPNLQKLVIDHVIHTGKGGASDARHVSFSDFGCAPNFKLEKLRFVNMTHVIGLPPQMAFIRFLLERSPVLETMHFGMLLTLGKIFDLNVKLGGYSRAFPNVTLVFDPN